jgi:leader peptidase (prepilin peptidase)/N-methyltransferase
MKPVTPEILHGFALVFGAVVGSFLNVMIWRLPRGESLIRPGSHCPLCGAAIRWYDNIPILSWLMLRGRCRHCRAWISIRYPLVEAAAALLSFFLYRRFGHSWHYLIYFGFASALLAASVIDLAHRIIPDEISLTGTAAGLLIALLPHAPVPFVSALFGALAGFLSLFMVMAGYWLITRREGMGLGDPKLLAAIGAFLGWQALPFVVLAGSFFGVMVGLPMILWAKKGRYYKIPFGPFLSLGAWLWLLFGPVLREWFFHFPGGVG